MWLYTVIHLLDVCYVRLRAIQNIQDYCEKASHLQASLMESNIEVCLEQLQGILVALLLRAIDVDVDIDIDIANDNDIEIGIDIEIYIDICLGPCLLGLRIGGAII